MVGTQHTIGPNGERNQAFGSSNSNQQNKFGTQSSGSQTNTEIFNENGIQGEKASSSSFSSSVNNGNRRGRRSADDDDEEPRVLTNRQKRSAQRHHRPHGPPEHFNPHAQQNFGFQQQNTGANTQTSNIQNEFGNFQNTGGSSIASNIGNNGQFGQLSAANTAQQAYHTGQGSGEKNNAQSQSANFNPFGLQTNSANSGE